MSYTNTGRFQYNFTRQSEFQQLRQKNEELERQNQQLKRSLQQLLQSHEQLAQQFTQLQKMHEEGQNAEQMQQKIQLLTDEVQTLRRQIQQVQYQKSKTSNRRDSNAVFDDNKQTEQVVQVLQEMTESFQTMQDKYEGQIDQQQKEVSNLKNQLGANLKKLEQQYNQKIQTFQDVLIQLKRKDQLVSLIQDKLKMSQDALRALAQSSFMQKQVSRTEQKNTASRQKNDQNIAKGVSNQQKQNLISELEQKNKVIDAYQQLIAKLRQRLEEKI